MKRKKRRVIQCVLKEPSALAEISSERDIPTMTRDFQLPIRCTVDAGTPWLIARLAIECRNVWNVTPSGYLRP